MLTCAVALANGVSAGAAASECASLERAVGCSALVPEAGAWLAAPEQMSCSVSLEPDLALRPLPARPSLLLQPRPCRLQCGMSVAAQQGYRRQGKVSNPLTQVRGGHEECSGRLVRGTHAQHQQIREMITSMHLTCLWCQGAQRCLSHPSPSSRC